VFRFTIRDVLWLMVVLAMGAGWYADHRNVKWQASLIEGDKAMLIDHRTLQYKKINALKGALESNGIPLPPDTGP